MVKQVTLLLVFGLICLAGFSQPYGNEWINYDGQRYFRMQITKDGIYRINTSLLAQAEIPFEDILVQNYQVFHRGREIPIYVKYNTLGILQYIEFYGRKNDGWLDSLVYEIPSEQTNPYYSQYTDTAAYYLTWNQSLNNKRYSLETDTLFSNYPVAAFCFADQLYSYHSFYNYCDGENPSLTGGEGWVDNYFSIGGSKTKSIVAPSISDQYASAFVKTTLVGVSNSNSGANNHHVSLSINNNSVFDTIYSAYGPLRTSNTIPASWLSATNSFKFQSINNLYLNADKNSIAYIWLRYPRNFNFSGFGQLGFIVPQSTNKSTIEIGVGSGSGEYVLYDLTNWKRVELKPSGGTYKGVLYTGSAPECYFAGTDSVYSVTALKELSFLNFATYGLNSDYLIISHNDLWASALEYEAYRNSTGYQSLLVNMEDLYDQFGYGVRKHPMALRNFAAYLLSIYDEAPKSLFLLGKGVHTPSTRFDPYRYSLNMIPAYGVSSDVPFTAGLNGTDYEPAIPTGRLSAWTNAEVRTYLNKVQIYENNPPADWMKNVIHFGGGYDPWQQQTFAGYLATYENIISGTLFGGLVSTYLRTGSDPIEPNTSSTVRDLINNGVSLMTFFGHGAATVGFDQSIDDPETFQNTEEFPFILANSCYVGDVYLTSTGISEKWVFDSKGAIGFLAGTGLSHSSDLHLFSTEFYKQLTYKNYGSPVGKLIQQTIKTIQPAKKSGNKLITNALKEFTLHGDPAIVINSFPKPDLEISAADISFNPTTVTTDIDSFRVEIVVTNIGRAFTDDYLIRLKRTFSDNTEFITYATRPGCLFRDTVKISIPVEQILGLGMNTFSVELDFENQIDELSESNNFAQKNLLIVSDDVVPVYPYEYAIHPESSVTLIASTSNPFGASLESIFEIDTTDLFLNPLDSVVVSHSGGVVEWQVPFSLEPNRVYYWRVSKLPDDPSNSDEYGWRESSFIYIPGKTGWSQAHFYQFKKDEYKFIEFDRNELDFDFINTDAELHCHNVGLAWGDANWFNVSYSIMNMVERSSCGAIHQYAVAVLDSLTLLPWTSERADYNHNNYPVCYNGVPAAYFNFSSSDQGRLDMANFITNDVPDGNYILMYTFISGDFAEWDNEIYEAFENLVTVPIIIRQVQDDFPYIFFCKKGTGIVREAKGAHDHDEIDVYYNLPRSFLHGDITSTVVGPSAQWNTLKWAVDPAELPDHDETSLDVIGIKMDGTEEPAITNLLPFVPELNNLYDYIDAEIYPYLRLQLHTRDDSMQTPAQMNKWQIMYEGIPETALNPPDGYYFASDTLVEGENIKFSIATRNISPYDMDSLLVSYFMLDRHNEVHDLGKVRMRNHPAGDVLILDTLVFSTLGYGGLNSLWVEVNPRDTVTGDYDQLEQYHFNNIANVYFMVETDRTNPVLDVTFDGVHIMDGDIISAKPEILITLSDENKYLALNNPDDFAVYLVRPGSDVEEKIEQYNEEGTEILKWTPAELPDNSCRLVFNPDFKQDGLYKLRVQATDMSNNLSGDEEYQVTFEVINKASITNVFNYPNPFSTSTRFVFDLTGSEIPDVFEIRIMTITGKLVKVINLEDLGTLRIGKNITEYAWDGFDMYGDPLANGVYFYTVTTRLDGKSMDLRQTDADHFFKKGMGKLYIMR